MTKSHTRWVPSPTYNSWRSMHDRCKTKKGKIFKYYGARGITVCERWKTFESFLEDMGERPSMHYSLDRIDNDGNYEPGNCRWATRTQQASNTRPHLRRVKEQSESVPWPEAGSRIGPFLVLFPQPDIDTKNGHIFWACTDRRTGRAVDMTVRQLESFEAFEWRAA